MYKPKMCVCVCVCNSNIHAKDFWNSTNCKSKGSVLPALKSLYQLK